MKRWEQISSTHRKLEWVAARLAAKYLFLSRFELGQYALPREQRFVKLTRDMLRRHSPWMYRSVEVLPPDDGSQEKPVLTWCGTRRDENVSLSHANGVSCASISTMPTAVDIEVATSRVGAFYRKTFTAAEQSWVTSSARDDEFKASWFFTLLWTLKESALKLKLLTSATLWELPRIEIKDLPDPHDLGKLTSDHVVSFPVRIKEPQGEIPVQVAVAGTRKWIVTVMNSRLGVLHEFNPHSFRCE
ncbi:MAG TPA: 4'-phosphopantetheinyl transferase superfamily protein [Pyrinomonadaceae bacterium]|nr:4'-phosphopantetheinyl transferase superfamily protein [Pyrinomonadaceae bacterium]